MDTSTTTPSTITAAQTEAAPRRLDNSLLDKSLDELIKTNRRANKNNKKNNNNNKNNKNICLVYIYGNMEDKITLLYVCVLQQKL